MKLIIGLTLIALLSGTGLSQPYVPSPSYFGLIRAGDWKYLNWNGEAVLTDYYGSGPDLIIPSSINGIPVKWIGGGAYSLTSQVLLADPWAIKNVHVPDGVVEIQEEAFNYFYALTNVNLSSSVTNITGAFSYCINLKNINLTTNITSIGPSTFAGCISLTNITLPNNLKAIGGGAFQQTGLNNISIPNSVTNIGPAAFKDCTNLISINLPQNLPVIPYGLLQNCSNLVSVTMLTNTHTISDYAFNFCAKLNEILFPDTTATIGEFAFAYTPALKAVSLPDGINEIKRFSFAGSGITNVQLGNNILNIESSAFFYCQSLNTINIPTTITNFNRDAFHGCISLTNIFLTGDVPLFSISVFPSNATIFYQTNKSGWSTFNFEQLRQEALRPSFSSHVLFTTNSSTKLKLKLRTVRGLSYSIQKSTDLFSWQNQLNLSGNNSEQEYEEAVQDKAFFRILQN